MNEQQLADLFSEQLDQMLLGESVSLPEEAAEIEGLLQFGQQVSQIEFQALPATQAAFQGQVTSWFDPGGGATPALWGLSKSWATKLGIAAIVGGAGLGALLLANSTSVPDNVDTQRPPAQQIEVSPEELELDATGPNKTGSKDKELPIESDEDSIETPSTSTGDTVVPPKPSSLGDKLPVSVPSPSIGDTIIVPAKVPTETLPAGTEDNGEVGAGIEDGNTAPGSTNTGNNSDAVSGSEDDRGHGNDPGGYDPDNPGNSSGVPSNDSKPNFSRGDGDGSSGGNNSSGGKDTSNKKDKNENRDKDDK